MIDRTGVNVTDFARSRAFREAALRPLGASLPFAVPPEHAGGAQAGRDSDNIEAVCRARLSR